MQSFNSRGWPGVFTWGTSGTRNASGHDSPAIHVNVTLRLVGFAHLLYKVYVINAQH